MRVFVLGGTGLIGSAVVREMVRRGHQLFGLARSGASAAKLDQFGVTAIAGDIGAPEGWVARLPPLDAVVHMACDFNTDMGAIDRRLLDRLLPALGANKEKPRFLYTGGCWLFGATGDDLATEETPFRPLPAFAWMAPQLQRILASTEVHGIAIHPAMVHAGDRGVFERFARAAAAGQAVPVVGSEAVRWPLVHAEDLADLSALALERGTPGSSYMAAAVEGFPVGRIARAYARRFGTATRPRRSSQRMQSPPNSANGPGAMRSTSSSAAQKRGASSAGRPGISIRKPRSRSLAQIEGATSFASR